MHRLRRSKIADGVKSFRRAWLSACNAAGVPGRIFLTSAGRRFATWSARACLGRWRCRWSGNKTEAIHRRYAVVSDADLRAAADELAAIEPHQ